MHISKVNLYCSEVLHEIHSHCFKESWSVNAFIDILKNPFCSGFIYESLGQNVGFIIGQNIDAQIYTLCVTPKYRNIGIGSALLEKFISSVDRPITIEVAKQNQSALTLYYKFGFKNIGERKNYYGDGLDAIVMQLS